MNAGKHSRWQRKRAPRRAHGLLSRLQREGIFQAYVVKRIWFLLPLSAMLVLLLLGLMLALLSLAMAQFQGPADGLVRFGLFVLASVGGMLASTLVLYVLFSWLEKRAIADVMRRLDE